MAKSKETEDRKEPLIPEGFDVIQEGQIPEGFDIIQEPRPEFRAPTPAVEARQENVQEIIRLGQMDPLERMAEMELGTRLSPLFETTPQEVSDESWEIAKQLGDKYEYLWAKPGDRLSTRAFLGSMKERATRAWNMYGLSQLYLRKLYGEDTEQLNSAIEAMEAKVGKAKISDLHKGTILERAVGGALEQMPRWAWGTAEGLKIGLGGAAASMAFMAIAGQFGPQVSTPEEIVTVPAAGLTAMQFGLQAGAMKEMMEYSAAMAYRNLLLLRDKNGDPIDERTARVASMGIGLFEGLLEYTQFTTYLRSFKGISDKVLRETINTGLLKGMSSQTMANALAKYMYLKGELFTQEVSEEMMQEIVGIIGEEIAKEASNRLAGTEFNPKTMAQIADQYYETAIESALTIAGMTAITGAEAKLVRETAGIAKRGKMAKIMGLSNTELRTMMEEVNALPPEAVVEPVPEEEAAPAVPETKEEKLSSLEEAFVEGELDEGTYRIAKHLTQEVDPTFEYNSSIEISRAVRRASQKELQREGITPEEGVEFRVLGETISRVERDNLHTAIRLYRGADADTVVEEWYHRAFDRLSTEDRALYEQYHQATGDPRSVNEHFAQEGRDLFFSEKLHERAGGIRQLFQNAREALIDLVQRIRRVRGADIPVAIQKLYLSAGEVAVESARQEVERGEIVDENISYQIRPPTELRSKETFNRWYNGLSEKAKDTFHTLQNIKTFGDTASGFYQFPQGYTAKGKTELTDKNPLTRYMTNREWNAYIDANPELATKMKGLFDLIPEEVRRGMGLQKNGKLKLGIMDGLIPSGPKKGQQEFLYRRSMMQRIVDAMPTEKISALYKLPNGTEIDLGAGDEFIYTYGGEDYRQGILNEKRRLWEKNQLRKWVLNDNIAKDGWEVLNFLAPNSKTLVSGDFTTLCPQVMFNKGCFYCYRRSAPEEGVNVKLGAEKVWYTGELLHLKPEDIKRLNKLGGLRIQSFGDWFSVQPQAKAMLTDMIYDAELLATRHKEPLQIKIITKSPEMVEFVAQLKEQGLGRSVFMNLSVDYFHEPAGNPTHERTKFAPLNPSRPWARVDRDGESMVVWKRALSVEEAWDFIQQIEGGADWINIRTVALTVDEAIRGLEDPRVTVVTGYHGNVQAYHRVQADTFVQDPVNPTRATGQWVTEVEPIGDAGLPRFDKNGKLIRRKGMTAVHIKLGEAIEREGLQVEYLQKMCCITGFCPTCQTKCGATQGMKEQLKGHREFDKEAIPAGEAVPSLQIRALEDSKDRVKLANELESGVYKKGMITGQIKLGDVVNAMKRAEKEGVKRGKEAQREVDKRRRDAVKVHAYAKKLGSQITRPIPKTVHFSYHEAIEALISDIDPSFRTEKTLERRARIKEYLAANPKGLDAMPRKVLEALEKRPLQSFTIKELESLKRQRDYLEKLGKNKMKLRKAQRQRFRAQWKNDMLEAQDSARVGEEDLKIGAAADRAGFIKKSARGLRAWTLTMERVLDKLDGGANFQGKHHEFFLDRYNDQWERMQRKVAFRNEKGEAVRKKLKVGASDLGKVYYKLRGNKLTHDEGITFYVASKNRKKAAHIIWGYGITEDEFNDVIAKLPDKYKKWGDYMIEDYAVNEKGRMREAYMEYNNDTDFGDEENYTPIIVIGDGAKSIDEQLIREFQHRQAIGRRLPEKGFTLKRKDIPPEAQQPIQLGETEIWLKHIGQAELYIANTGIIQDMNSMLADAEFTTSIRTKWGESYLEQLERYVQRLADPSVMRASDGASRISRLFRNNVAIAYLSFNLVTSAKQLPSLLYVMPYSGPGHLITSAFQYAMRPTQMIKRTQDMSMMMKFRSFDRFQEELRQASAGMYNRIIRASGKAGMQLIYLMDKTATTIGWNAVFDKVYRETRSVHMAAQSADNVISRTQPSFRPQDIAGIYATGSEFFNWINQFSNQLNKIYNMWSYDVPMQFKTGRPGRAMMSLFGMGAASLMIWSISHRRMPEDEEELRKALIEGWINTLPIVGRVITSSMKGYSSHGIPVFEVTSEAISSLRKLSDKDRIQLAAILEASAVLMGLPFTGVKRALEAREEGDWRLLFGKRKEKR